MYIEQIVETLIENDGGYDEIPHRYLIRATDKALLINRQSVIYDEREHAVLAHTLGLIGQTIGGLCRVQEGRLRHYLSAGSVEPAYEEDFYLAVEANKIEIITI